MRDLLVLGIIFGSLPFILYRPWLGILMWYWIGLMSPHRLGWGGAFNFPVAQLVALAALSALLLSRNRKTVPFTRETLFLGLFTLHITITTYFAWSPSAWEQWDKVMKILLITFVTPMLIYGRERIIWLVIVVVLSIGFYGFKGGLFSVLTGGTHYVWGPPGTFIGGNTNLGMGMIMTLPLILVVARALRERRLGIPFLDRWSVPLGLFTYAVFGLTIIATVFTYSRGAWVALAVVAPFIFLKMRYKLPLAVAGFLLAGTVVALLPEQLINRAETIQTYEEDYSAMQRLQAWGVNWNMAVERPLVGTGFNNPDIGDERWLNYANWIEPWASTARAAHSIFFQILGHHGFLGAAIYFTMLLFTVLTLIRVYRHSGRHPSTLWMRDIAWALLVGMVGFSAAGAFLDMAYFTLIYVFIALTVILRRELDLADVRDPGVFEGEATARKSGKSGKDLAFPDFVAPGRRD